MKDKLLSEETKNKLSEPYSMPVWVILVGVALVLVISGIAISASDALEDTRQELEVIQDASNNEVTESVASNGLSYTWDWWASHMLMWLYHGRNVFGLVLAVILLIHGFKVVGR